MAKRLEIPGDERKKRSPGLSDKMRRFINEYPKHTDAKAAARAAGYVAPQAASRLLQNPLIVQALDLNAAARRRHRNVSEENIQEELSRMGFANILNHFDQDTGAILAPHELPRDVAAAVKKLKVSQTEKDGEITTEAELELLDKKGALELLGRRFGMWDNKDNRHGVGLAYIESLGRTVGPTGKNASDDQ